MSKNSRINEIAGELLEKFSIYYDKSLGAIIADLEKTNFSVVGDKASRSKIERYIYKERGEFPAPEDTTAIIKVIKSIAEYESPKAQAFRRAAKVGGDLVIDMGLDNEQRITVTRDGVETGEVYDIYFERSGSMTAMAEPEEGGSESDLRELINTTDENFKVLFAWMTYVLFTTKMCDGALPLVMINSPKGAGKTTVSRFLVDLLDPQEAPIRVFPDKKQDLIIALQQAYVLCFDNLRKIAPVTSDLLCSAASGGYTTGRELYTNSFEHRMWIKNPIIVNGLHYDMATEMDLISRMILLELLPIDDSKRRTDADLKADFEAKKGRYLWVILNGISKAMAHLEDVVLGEMSRMADFCRWGKAVELGMEWPEGSFMEAYKTNQTKLQRIATVENLLVQTVVEFLAERRGNWKSTPGELLDALNDFSTAGGRNNPKIWPQTPAALSRRLEAQQDALNINEVEVILYRSKQRQVELRRIEKPTEKAVAQSKVVDIRTGEATVTAEVPTKEVAAVDELVTEDEQVQEVTDQAEVELDAPEEKSNPHPAKNQRRRRRAQQAVDVRTNVDQTIVADEDYEVTAQSGLAEPEQVQEIVEQEAVAQGEPEKIEASVPETVVEGLCEKVGNDNTVESIIDSMDADVVEVASSKDRPKRNRRKRPQLPRRSENMADNMEDSAGSAKVEHNSVGELEQEQEPVADDPEALGDVVETTGEVHWEVAEEDELGESIETVDHEVLPEKPQKRVQRRKPKAEYSAAVAELQEGGQEAEEKKKSGLKRRLRKRPQALQREELDQNLEGEMAEPVGSIEQPEQQLDQEVTPKRKRIRRQPGTLNLVDEDGKIVGQARADTNGRRRTRSPKTA
ncbi:MAG: hypothetical protein GYB20_10785 [Oceanospirillales bacterium]|nr:hypothetical protein [Oceanospirillales bacterium]MBR9888163.1 hypothetical protein [Oceanospirillales bacterium]